MAAAPGSVRSESVRFLESACTAAGVLSASVVVPDGAILIDVIVHGVALWVSATSATLIVGDTADDDGIYTGVNLKATDLLAGESLSFSLAGGKMGADIAAQNDPTQASVAAGAVGQASRRKLSGARTLTAKVTTVGAPGAATGETIVVFVYAYPSPMAPTFTAS